MGKNRDKIKQKKETEKVVWEMFSESGSIGHYLLYKKLKGND